MGDNIVEGSTIILQDQETGGGNPIWSVYKWENGQWIATGDFSQNWENVKQHTLYGSLEEATTGEKGKGYGLESLKKSDFFEADGVTQKPISEIVALIKQHKPMPEGGDAVQYDEDIKAKIKDMMPKLQAIPEEEKGFAREGFQKDVYGISKDAGKAGAQMRSAYGSGMGSSMRGAYGAQKDVTQQFKQAEQGYAQDIYGLEQKQEAEFEGDIGTWLASFKQGGRVPSKQTFLDVLSKIPDAGGN